MDKIVISSDEVAKAPQTPPGGPPSALAAEAPLPPVIPVWSRVSLALLVPVLPVLCVLAVILRIAMRNVTPRVRFAWSNYFNTLLVISGLLTSIATVVAFSTGPMPSLMSQGLSDLDTQIKFPSLPADASLTPQKASEELKPLVLVLSPAEKGWFSKQEMPSNGLGAGILLQASKEGYLIATAKHVAGAKGEQTVMVATSEGIWSPAHVVARHSQVDISLIWLKRAEGSSSFVLPVDSADSVKDGDSIYVIGHPHGLRYTITTGIVSRADKTQFQISAPVSPGNSGGPMFDDRGRLAGVVVAMFDKNRDPNAENLNFAVKAEVLLDPAGWDFFGSGRKQLSDFIHAQKR